MVSSFFWVFERHSANLRHHFLRPSFWLSHMRIQSPDRCRWAWEVVFAAMVVGPYRKLHLFAHPRCDEGTVLKDRNAAQNSSLSTFLSWWILHLLLQQLGDCWLFHSVKYLLQVIFNRFGNCACSVRTEGNTENTASILKWSKAFTAAPLASASSISVSDSAGQQQPNTLAKATCKGFSGFDDALHTNPLRRSSLFCMVLQAVRGVFLCYFCHFSISNGTSVPSQRRRSWVFPSITLYFYCIFRRTKAYIASKYFPSFYELMDIFGIEKYFQSELKREDCSFAQ